MKYIKYIILILLIVIIFITVYLYVNSKLLSYQYARCHSHLRAIEMAKLFARDKYSIPKNIIINKEFLLEDRVVKHLNGCPAGGIYWIGIQDEDEPRCSIHGSYSDTPVHKAAIKDDVNELKKAINNGWGIKQTTHGKWEPLHCAVFNSCFNSVNYLLNNNADVNVNILNCFTPLDLAKDKQICAILKTYGATNSIYYTNIPKIISSFKIK